MTDEDKEKLIRDVWELYHVSMKMLMEKETKTHGCFFTQEEFMKNYGIISIMNGIRLRIENKIKKIKS